MKRVLESDHAEGPSPKTMHSPDAMILKHLTNAIQSDNASVRHSVTIARQRNDEATLPQRRGWEDAIQQLQHVSLEPEIMRFLSEMMKEFNPTESSLLNKDETGP